VRGLVLAVVLVSSGVTPWGGALAADSKPVRSLLAIRDSQVVRQHWDLSCGAAAIATVLTYQLGRPVSEREAAFSMLRHGDAQLIRARLGFSLLDLKRLAQSYGLQAVGYGGLTLDDLVALAPVIAPIQVYGFGHFVVVRGRLGDRLLVADPAFGNRTMTLRDFGHAWPSGVGFVIVRPDEPKPPNRIGAPAELFLAPSGTALRSAEASLRNLGGR
jgi:predicted double-glycine peptidase